jgi:hypothetical protein
MHGFALAFLSLSLAADPLELPRDVVVMETRQFTMPIYVDPARHGKMERIRFFISEDQGKTWKHSKDYKPDDQEVSFMAPRDGQYWFALLVEFKDGKSEPAEVDELIPAMKVYVNTEGKAVKRKTYEEVQREVEQLRKTVEQLQKRIKDLEADRKPK